jgi:AraC-like DNA-binding protein
MAQSNKSCAAYLQLRKRIENQGRLEPKTLKCFAGLCGSPVPVRVGDNLIAFLNTGQILLNQPSHEQFAKTTRALLKRGTEVDMKSLEEAYFQTGILKKKQYESALRLLAVFAQHLSSLSNELAMKEAAGESPSITRARVYIAGHHMDGIVPGEAARAVNMSSFYFCKIFKKASGMTFTDYLARVRVEKVKNLMLNPHKRISETAYEAAYIRFRNSIGYSATSLGKHLNIGAPQPMARARRPWHIPPYLILFGGHVKCLGPSEPENALVEGLLGPEPLTA